MAHFNWMRIKAEILALLSEELGDGYTWSEQDIWEQSRKIINRWNRMRCDLMGEQRRKVPLLTQISCP